GMTKEAYLEYQLNTAVTEGRNLDLITMGRGEGPECYCYPNTVIRRLIDSWSKNYDYVVIDNEAGMEHLSRRTTQNIDEMLIVSDYTIKGLRAAARIIELIRELALTVRRQSVLINTAPVQLELLFREEMERLGIVPAAIIPQDMTLARYDLEQKPLLELPDDSAAVMAMNTLLERLLNRPAAVIK
ncbi:MAG: carbon monoxide dehydrogenase, partial [Dehalococcoidales bacterium]|nr:carbon monoxide dehydrogenase [Dehalococcoidales bacterium]